MDHIVTLAIVLSLIATITGSLILIIGAMFPSNNRDHRTAFQAGLVISNIGYRIAMAGAVMFLSTMLVSSIAILIYEVTK